MTDDKELGNNTVKENRNHLRNPDIWFQPMGDNPKDNVDIRFRWNGFEYVYTSGITLIEAVPLITVLNSWGFEKLCLNMDEPKCPGKSENGLLHAEIMCVSSPEDAYIFNKYELGSVEDGLLFDSEAEGVDMNVEYKNITELNEDWEKEGYQFKILRYYETHYQLSNKKTDLAWPK